jgi:hypothetical protein
LKQLDDYRSQYGKAKSNSNEIQQNRIFDARKEFLCNTEAKVNNWSGEVYKVDTSWLNSRQRASVDLRISWYIWVRGKIVDAKENPELFEAIATLNKGDHVTFSGMLGEHDGCVHEVSLTQQGGMTTPEFNISYSLIKRSSL